MSWMPAQYLIAATRRQLILDHLIEHPGALMGEIGAHLAAHGDPGNAANTVRTMADWSELRFEGNARSRRYFALVEKTRSAEECKAMREANLATANAAKQRITEAAEARPAEQGRYMHKPGAHPIRNQGGQGAARARVYVNCGGLHA